MSCSSINNLLHLDPTTKSNATRFVRETLTSAGIFALGAKVFTVINPLAGAIAGGTYYASSTAINWLCDKAHIGQNGFVVKITRSALSALAGITLGILAVKAAGFPITFTAALILPAASLGIYCLAAGAIVVAIAGVGSIFINNFSLEELLTGTASLIMNQLPAENIAEIPANDE